jgi:hypothetical protein
LECTATGQWPDDPGVRMRAGIIKQITDQVERIERDHQSRLMETYLQVPKI